MYFITLTTLLAHTLASPTPTNLAPRCGTTLQPTILQQIKESSPNTVYPNSASFSVSQFSSASNRVNQIVTFSGIPSGAYGCSLNVQFPPFYPLQKTGYPTLNVRTFNPSPTTTPNNWSWSTIFTPAGVSPAVGTGIFGTTNFAQGQSATINSQGCGTSGGLGYVFEIANWVYGEAGVGFQQGEGAGVFLTYNC